MEGGEEAEPSPSPEENDGGVLYPMCFGISCAFVASGLLLLPSRTRALDVERAWRMRTGEMMLKGSALLLGLLVERAQRRRESMEQRLKKSEMELEEMRRVRAEDAKANEKVVGIFAAHEQRWIAERKSARLQIQALVNEQRIAKVKNDAETANLQKRIEEEARALRIKDEALEEEARKRNELESKLHLAEEATAKLRERAEKDAQDHAAELWKHKTAFVELVSSQRQAEAELSRALAQLEVAHRELDEATGRKEEALAMVEKLSADIAETHKDSEQKGKILSAMLRKSKVDAAERQALLKEVKMAKAKKKQAELEKERWRNMWEPRQHKRSPRTLHTMDQEIAAQSQRMKTQVESNGSSTMTLVVEHPEADEARCAVATECLDHCSSDGNDDPGDDFSQLQDWVRLETEKYTSMIEQRHYAEIEAFTEQMRLKDEKLEAHRWRILSMELESKRLQSHIEGLDGNLAHFREENIKLEGMLIDKEKELKSLKEQLSLHVQHLQKNSKNNCSPIPESCQSKFKCTVVKATKGKPRAQEEGSVMMKLTSDAKKTQNKTVPMDCEGDIEDTKLMQLEVHQERETTSAGCRFNDLDTSTSSNSQSPSNNQSKDFFEGCRISPSPEQPETIEKPSQNQVQCIQLDANSMNAETGEEIEVKMDLVSACEPKSLHENVEVVDKLSSFGPSFVKKDCKWKTDIHSLGVSYKIKRLKHQLLVLEKLAESQGTKHVMDDAPDEFNKRKTDEHRKQMKGLQLMKSLLNKQLKRYQSLEEKTDDLCRRMHDNYQSGSRRELRNARSKEQIKILTLFLEETFLLQRYLVATGQKLMEIQSRIATSSTVALKLCESIGFNMAQFSDVVRTLFREVQRGLEVRIVRIIGELEGTLASEGILHR